MSWFNGTWAERVIIELDAAEGFQIRTGYASNRPARSRPRNEAQLTALNTNLASSGAFESLATTAGPLKATSTQFP
ncbi:uncharacterized protein YueI [Saccharopolyspora phatthalungensis]|uniref:Uncharacterized protein YueI n=1 Tax=Saccharopolyspora phatthalungensis TaxID=664693 RepID=A0A840PYA5_9PSEU|nr:uncharacterized protein YueI [Saccharopolyspora phatthalungensis]